MHFNRKKIPQKKRLKISPNVINRKSPLDEDIKHSPRVRSRKKRSIPKLSIIKNADGDRYQELKKWRGRLRGIPSFILGNAPSIAYEDISILESYFTIGVNRIFYIFDPTMLLWQDQAVWLQDKKKIMKQKAIKICRDRSDPMGKFLNFELSMGKFKFGDNPSLLHGRGNTGVLAIQLAVSLGCSCVVLLGMDCKYEGRNKTDFYGKNKDHQPYTLKMCNNAMNWIKDKCPVPVYNCSDTDIWERRSLSDVIEEIQPEILSRDYFFSIFKKK